MAAEVSGHPDPLTVTTHFLRPALAGAGADLGVEVIRRGRRTSTVRASLTQGQKVRLESMATFGELGLGARSDPGLDIAPPDLPAPEDCVDRSRLAQGDEPALLSRIDARIDPAQAPIMSSPGDSPETSTANSTEKPTGDQGMATANAADATIAGWMRFHDGRPVDSRALVLFADCFPPSVFSAVGRTGWVPTIELTVHVRRRPVPGWIRARFTTRDLAGDLLIEDGLLWDETGQVVAQSRQLALLAR